MTLKIAGIESFSMLDYPDKLSAVLFCQGCPLRCPYCHNKKLQVIDSDNLIPWKNVIKFLESRKDKLDAVVFSGGEPLFQKYLKKAVVEVFNLGFDIGLHTAGYKGENLAQLLPWLSWVGLDIKTFSHLQSWEILKSLMYLKGTIPSFECRTTVYPIWVDKKEIFLIAQDLKKYRVKKYVLQEYRPVESCKTTLQERTAIFEDKELMEELKSMFETFEVRRI